MACISIIPHALRMKAKEGSKWMLLQAPKEICSLVLKMDWKAADKATNGTPTISQTQDGAEVGIME